MNNINQQQTLAVGAHYIGNWFYNFSYLCKIELNKGFDLGRAKEAITSGLHLLGGPLNSH